MRNHSLLIVHLLTFHCSKFLFMYFVVFLNFFSFFFLPLSLSDSFFLSASLSSYLYADGLSNRLLLSVTRASSPFNFLFLFSFCCSPCFRHRDHLFSYKKYQEPKDKFLQLTIP